MTVRAAIPIAPAAGPKVPTERSERLPLTSDEDVQRKVERLRQYRRS